MKSDQSRSSQCRKYPSSSGPISVITSRRYPRHRPAAVRNSPALKLTITTSQRFTARAFLSSALPTYYHYIPELSKGGACQIRAFTSYRGHRAPHGTLSVGVQTAVAQTAHKITLAGTSGGHRE